MKLQIATHQAFNKIEYCVDGQFVNAAPDLTRLSILRDGDKVEVLAFLEQRPVHTVVMTSFINDNGLENPDNRGIYYGFRSLNGKLDGVALIGHTTLFEARTDEALKAFAEAARTSETPIHLLMSDGNSVDPFWKDYAGENQRPRLTCTELLFELNFPFLVQKDSRWDIRLASEDELLPIAEAHAGVAFMESGVDPMEKDREGFLKRCLKRIEMKRTFVVFDNGKLVFKADIAAETDNVVYLEGIFVSAEYRGQNVGSTCLAKLSLELLNRAAHICLLSNVEFKTAHRSFVKAGFIKTDQCQTIFV